MAAAALQNVAISGTSVAPQRGEPPPRSQSVEIPHSAICISDLSAAGRSRPFIELRLVAARTRIRGPMTPLRAAASAIEAGRTI